MPTDLKAVKDHPAQILHDREETLIRDDGKDLGSVRYAANILWAYESNNNVVFVALDNDVLAALREAYGRNGRISARAVVDLLGLE